MADSNGNMWQTVLRNTGKQIIQHGVFRVPHVPCNFLRCEVRKHYFEHVHPKVLEHPLRIGETSAKDVFVSSILKLLTNSQGFVSHIWIA